jgi:hypothetical protein
MTFCISGGINFTAMQFSTSPLSSRRFVRYGKLKFKETLSSFRELMTVVEALPQSFRQEVTNMAATLGLHHIPDISVEFRSFVEFLLTPFTFSCVRRFPWRSVHSRHSSAHALDDERAFICCGFSRPYRRSWT